MDDPAIERRIGDYRQRACAILDAASISYDVLSSLDDPTQQVELEIAIPKQNGMPFGLLTNLQNDDEVWFHIAGSTFSYFPYDQKAEFILDRLKQFVTGAFRIVEHTNRKGIVVRSQLQSRQAGRWEAVASYGTLRALWPFGTTKQIKSYSEASA